MIRRATNEDISAIEAVFLMPYAGWNKTMYQIYGQLQIPDGMFCRKVMILQISSYMSQITGLRDVWH